MMVLLAGLAMPAMALKPGGKAPGFTVVDSQGQTHKLSQYKGKTVVLEWLNHGCPFVVKHYKKGNMQGLQKKWTAKGVVWLSVASSAAGKQGYMDAAGTEKARKDKKSSATAILLDADGKVGKKYGAKTTPHMFVIDGDGKVAYQGAIDDKPSTDTADIRGAVNHVDAALTALAEGKPVETPVTQPYGCGVKY
jgi:peroxiredoxin